MNSTNIDTISKSMLLKMVKPVLIIICICLFFAPSLTAQYTDSYVQGLYEKSDTLTSFHEIRNEIEKITRPDFTRHGIFHSQYPGIKEGIFCRWEGRINRKSSVPVKFRLGSLQYADQLEGKNSAFPLHAVSRP